MAPTEQQRKANVKLALILASVAVMLFVGFMVKSAFLAPCAQQLHLMEWFTTTKMLRSHRD